VLRELFENPIKEENLWIKEQIKGFKLRIVIKN
jgi:hypothetical protein